MFAKLKALLRGEPAATLTAADFQPASPAPPGRVTRVAPAWTSQHSMAHTNPMVYPSSMVPAHSMVVQNPLAMKSSAHTIRSPNSTFRSPNSTFRSVKSPTSSKAALTTPASKDKAKKGQASSNLLSKLKKDPFKANEHRHCLESLLRATFVILEGLWLELDPRNVGFVSLSRFAFIFSHKGMKEATEIKTWFNVPLDIAEDTIMFYEFLGLMFFWQARAGMYKDMLLDALTIQTLANGLNALVLCYRHYDFQNRKALAMIEVQHFLHDKLPEIHKMNWEPVVKQFFAGRKQIRFPQFVGLAYVILQGTDFLKRPPLRQYRYTEQMFLGHLREAFIVLEADFASLDQGRGYVPLEVFMLPSAHRFEWISAADRSHDWIKVVRCDGCMAPDPVWRCPHPNCYVYVCHSCWEQGMKSHTIPAGGAGTRLHCEAVQEMTRAVFARVDHTESGNLDFFDFLTLSFLMIRLGFEYQDFVHSAEDPVKVKKALSAIGRSVEEFDANKSGTLTLDEISMFCRKFVPSLPHEVRVPKFEHLDNWYTQLCQERGKLQLAGFLHFLYLLVRPDGKLSPEYTQPGRPQADPTRPLAEVIVHKPVLLLTELECPDTVPSTPKVLQAFRPEKLVKLCKVSDTQQIQNWRATYDGMEVQAQILMPSLSVAARARASRALELQARPHSRFVQAVLARDDQDQGVAILEPCTGGSVYGLYSKYSAKTLRRENPLAKQLQWRLALEVAEAMLDLNRAGVIHRNLCGNTVLLTGNHHVKLAHFDVATDEELCNHVVGTPGYMAPELMQGVNYGAQCDVFSYGSLLYEITHCRQPFYREPRKTQEEHFQIISTQVLSGIRPQLDSLRAPHRMLELIKACWATNPQRRPLFSDIIDVLRSMRHEFAVEDDEAPMEWPEEVLNADGLQDFEELPLDQTQGLGESILDLHQLSVPQPPANPEEEGEGDRRTSGSSGTAAPMEVEELEPTPGPHGDPVAPLPPADP